MIRNEPAVLLVTRNLPPLRGGMERLNLHMVHVLSKARVVCVVGPTGCSAVLPPQVATVEVSIKPLWRFIAAAALRGIFLARKYRPAWVLAGSGLTAPLAYLAGRLTKARVAVYLHGLDIVVPNRIYQAVWLPFIRASDLCIVNSHSTKILAIKSGVLERKIRILHPGVTLAEIPSDDVRKHAFSTQMGWSDRKVMLSVGRMTRRKGLLEFVEHSLPLIVEQCPSALLAIIGDNAPNALAEKNQVSHKDVADMADRLGLTKHVVFHGTLDDDALSDAYECADIYVFPVAEVSGDVEGFGMVAIEAAAHGLATVAFAVGGVTDAVSEASSGYLIQPGEYRAFAMRTAGCLTVGRETMDMSARKFAALFAWDKFGNRLRALLAEDAG